MTHFRQSMGESIDSPNFYKCSEPIKPKSKLTTKIGLAEEGDITIRGATTRILIFRTNWGTWSMNFTRRNPDQRTYNTEPSPKELAWGEALPCIQVSIISPFCLNFSFFSIVKKFDKWNKIKSYLYKYIYIVIVIMCDLVKLKTK